MHRRTVLDRAPVPACARAGSAPAGSELPQHPRGQLLPNLRRRRTQRPGRDGILGLSPRRRLPPEAGAQGGLVRRPRSLTWPSTIWSVGPRPAARATSLSAGTTSAASRSMPAIRSARSVAPRCGQACRLPARSRRSRSGRRRTARPACGCRRLAPLTATPSGCHWWSGAPARCGTADAAGRVHHDPVDGRVALRQAGVQPGQLCLPAGMGSLPGFGERACARRPARSGRRDAHPVTDRPAIVSYHPAFSSQGPSASSGARSLFRPMVAGEAMPWRSGSGCRRCRRTPPSSRRPCRPAPA